MKKFITLLVLIFLISVEYANADDRFKAGTWDLSIGSSASDFSITPSIGYFLLDNVEGIVHVDYSKLSSDLTPDFSDSEVTSMMVSAGITYHIPTQSNIVPALGGGLLYATEDEDFEDSSISDTSRDAVGIQVGFGLRFLIGEKASFNADISYAVIDADQDNTSADFNIYDLGISYSIFIK